MFFLIQLCKKKKYYRERKRSVIKRCLEKSKEAVVAEHELELKRQEGLHEQNVSEPNGNN